MEKVPDIIWILIGLLLFSILLVVGFKTTLKDFLKSKLAKTILCLIPFGVGVFFLINCLYFIINLYHPYTYTQDALIWNAIGAGIGGLVAIITALVWWSKVINAEEEEEEAEIIDEEEELRRAVEIIKKHSAGGKSKP